MVGTGSMVDGTFVATEILAKHDETYMPAEVVDALKEQGVYKDASGSPGS
jgi:cytochrome c-type biogenesis protein CcmE